MRSLVANNKRMIRVVWMPYMVVVIVICRLYGPVDTTLPYIELSQGSRQLKFNENRNLHTLSSSAICEMYLKCIHGSKEGLSYCVPTPYMASCTSCINN